ncbi:MAG TPA: SDR family NAD(P)-dependent oxidoreductase [Acidimicrobiales bacterium]|nr:SDR family NAD(P)-dependent oxidoreductase [Acidimicrobiales bacterium]
MRFEGRVAIVTGAASGIGRATADRLADEGATVVRADVAKEGLDDDAIVGDVSDPSFAPLLVAQTVDRHGRIDVLANVAGILRTANTHEHPLDTWDQVLAINLTGTFLCCRYAIPELLKTRGNIVNVSSTAALAGHPWAAAYSASKGGVLALTRTIAVEYGRRGVRCNAVCPGSIQTPITKDFDFPEGADMDLVRRIMALDKARGPETVAAAIAFLASDDAAHVNGDELRVDGGTLS